MDRFGAKQTHTYLAKIEDVIDRATKNRRLLRHRPELGEHIYSVRCVSHVAFLAEDKTTGIWLVVAVLHGRMDPARHLKAGEDE